MGGALGLLRFREDTNPYIDLVRPGWWIHEAPPPLDLEGFERRTGIRSIYVVLFGRPARGLGSETGLAIPDLVAFELRKFESVLNDRYALVKASPLGLWELWGRRISSSGKRLPSCPE